MSNFSKRFLSSIFLIPLVFFIIYYGNLILVLFTFSCLILAFYEWYTISRNIILRFSGFIFLLFSFFSFYMLSFELNKIFFVIIICITTDIGGYFFGKLLKGPKLIKISPKKTYSGMLGGYFLSLTSSFLIGNYFQIFNLDIYLFILVFTISTISQIGDILISYFKRLSKIKDTGNLIPGHGGLLDRIDGMIFAFPIFYLLNIFGFFSL